MSLLPEMVRRYRADKHLGVSSWCEMNRHKQEAAFNAAMATTHTREQAVMMMEFWKRKYYSALRHCEDITRPFNGVNDVDRTAALNEPVMRLQIDMADAYCDTPSYEYTAARRVLEIKFPETK